MLYQMFQIFFCVWFPAEPETGYVGESVAESLSYLYRLPANLIASSAVFPRQCPEANSVTDREEASFQTMRFSSA